MIKILIVLKKQIGSNLTPKHDLMIREWFINRYFEIPFLPKVGMFVDLSDFCDSKEIINKFENLRYAKINQIVIRRSYICLYCTYSSERKIIDNE